MKNGQKAEHRISSVPKAGSIGRGNDSVAPSIVILPFENASGDPRANVVARGLTFELVAALTKSDGLSVFGAAAHAVNRDNAAEPTEGDYNYALFGSTQVHGATVRIIAILADHRSGRLLKSWAFEIGSSTRHYLDSLQGITAQISMGVTHLTGKGIAPSGVQCQVCPLSSAHTGPLQPVLSFWHEGPANCV